LPGLGYKIVLTADRTLMSEYHGGIFLGFSACFPRGIIPDSLYFGAFCPPVKVKEVSAEVAPYGTRKVEAALLQHGFEREDIVVAPPRMISQVVGVETKVVGLTETDPLGLAPATSTFKSIWGKESYMENKLREALRQISDTGMRPKIIVGGPGAWQLEPPDVRRRLGVDCAVVGEGEDVVGPLFEAAVKEEPIPGVVHGEIVPTNHVPIIQGASVGGLVEVARGCGRGCAFCVPTMRAYRCMPIDHILKEVKINLRSGRQPLLHAEDILRYRAHGLQINEQAVVELFKSVRGFPGVWNVGISHFALSSALVAPGLVEEISAILRLGDEVPWLSGQVGIETGSPRLIKDHMEGKCKPFKPDEWPEIVVRSFEVLAQNNWVPVGTLILGLPREEKRDVEETISLVRRLRPFKSLIVPLFFVSEGSLSGTESFCLDKMTREHGELMITCWEHNFEWIPKMFWEYNQCARKSEISMLGVRLVIWGAIPMARRYLERCRRDYDCDMKMMIQDLRGESSPATRARRLLTPVLRISR